MRDATPRPTRDQAPECLPHHQGEEGAINVAAAFGMLVVLLMSAVVIDVGSLVLARRDLQGAVDLAALDAVRALDHVGDPDPLTDLTARSQQFTSANLAANQGWSARRRDATTTVGTFDRATGVFTPTDVAPDAVLVEASTTGTRLTDLLPGSDLLRRQAVAELVEVGTSAIGSGVASVDSSRAASWNQLLSGLLDGPVTIDAVGWQGLAGGRVPLSGLMTAFDVATIDQLLDLQVTAGQLFDATASGLTAQGDPLSVQTAGILQNGTSTISNSGTFRLGDLLAVERGIPGSVANATVNVRELVTGAATIINEQSVVDLDLDLAGIPGVTTGAISLAVLEAPTIAIGRPGRAADGSYRTVARSAQLRLGVDLELDPLGSFAGVSVGSLSLPLRVDAGQATAALVDVACGEDARAFSRHLVDTTPVGVGFGAVTPEALLAPGVSGAGTLRGPLVDLSVDTFLTGRIPIASVTAAGSQTVPGVSGEDVTVTGPFRASAPITGNAPLDGALGEGLGLSGLLDDLDLDTTLLGVVGLDLSLSVNGQGGGVNLTEDVLAPALAAAEQTVADVDEAIGGTLDLLGIATLGDADLLVDGVDCTGRRLVR